MKIRIPALIGPEEAIRLQEKMAPLVSEESKLPANLVTLVGCDATYVTETTLAAATLVDYDELKLVKVSTVTEKTRFPYIAGLLAFREAPSVLRAIQCLKAKSYVCLVDAHGRAHPRKFGLACFVGLALDQPTIGVAKNLLYGRISGNIVVDKQGESLAAIIRLPDSEKTIYVSVGHKISLRDAVKIVEHCLTRDGPLPIKLDMKRCQEGNGC